MWPERRFLCLPGKDAHRLGRGAEALSQHVQAGAGQQAEAHGPPQTQLTSLPESAHLADHRPQNRLLSQSGTHPPVPPFSSSWPPRRGGMLASWPPVYPGLTLQGDEWLRLSVGLKELMLCVQCESIRSLLKTLPTYSRKRGLRDPSPFFTW